MKKFATWMINNFVHLLMAFFLARFVVRISSFVMPNFENYYILATFSLALQGLFFGIIFCLVKKWPMNIPLITAVALTAPIVGIPPLYLSFAGYIDMRWAIAALPLLFLAFSFVTMKITTNFETEAE